MNWEDVVALNRRSPASLSRLLSFQIEVRPASYLSFTDILQFFQKRLEEVSRNEK